MSKFRIRVSMHRLELCSSLAIVAVWAWLDCQSQLAGLGSRFVQTLGVGWSVSAVLGAGILLLGPGSNRFRLMLAGLAALAGVGLTAIAPGLMPGHAKPFAWCLVIGAGSVQLTLAGLRSEGRARRLRAVSRAVLLVGGVALAMLRDQSLGALNPTYDPGLFNFDQHLGLRVPALLELVLVAAPALKTALTLVYAHTPAIVALYDMGRDRKVRPPGLSMTAVFLITGLVGYAFYHAIPVAGPSALPIGYYESIWTTGLFMPDGFGTLEAGPSRGSMPSLHATWGYLLVLMAGLQPAFAFRWLMRMLGAATVLAAITVGKHWLLDLVIAVPFTVCVRAALMGGVSQWSRQSACSALVAGLLVACWFALIRVSTFEDLSIGTAWAAVLVTCAFPWAVSMAARLATGLGLGTALGTGQAWSGAGGERDWVRAGAREPLGPS